MVECPRSSWTNFAWTPRDSRMVAQVVEADWRQPRPFGQGPERTLGEVVAVEGGAELRGEHEAVLSQYRYHSVYLP